MIKELKDITSTKKSLKIEIPVEVIEKEYNSSLSNVRQRARIPGFRPGKAPVTMIEKKFGGDIKSDLIDRLVPKYYSEALKEAELSPVAMPKFEGSLDFKKDGPLSFALTVEVRPKVEGLSYSGLKVEDVPVTVEDKEVDEALKGFMEERAVFDVVDRQIKNDDLLIIDYVKLDASGQKEITSAKDQVMNLGRNLVPQTMMDNLVGKKKGDTVDIALPSVEGGEIKEDSLSGEMLKITIKEVKEKKLPALDDELAKDFGHDSLDALKEKITEGILKAKKERASGTQKEKILDMLLQAHKFDLPETLVASELERLVTNERFSNAKHKEGVDIDTPEPESEQALNERLRPEAEKHVKSSILLDIIGDKEGISVTEEEIKTRIGLLARHMRATPDAVVNLFMTRDGSLDKLSASIREEKVLDKVLSLSEIVKGAEITKGA